MSRQQIKWLYLIMLSLIWGSSFILIKKGLVGLSPLQVGSLRIVMAGFFLFAIGYKKILEIKKNEWKWIFVAGLLGTFFPAFLFAFGQTEIDSAIASILNSTVPLLTLITGLSFFGAVFIRRQFIGVMIGLLGTVMLIVSGASVHPDQQYLYALLPLFATIMYAFNANIIKHYLQEVPVLRLTVGSFVVIWPSALLVLCFTGFFNTNFLAQEETQVSIVYIVVLGVLGTGVAKVIFYRLVQISATVFSTSFTYLIPIVAFMWGFLDGETFGVLQLFSVMVILLGVYLSNRKGK